MTSVEKSLEEGLQREVPSTSSDQPDLSEMINHSEETKTEEVIENIFCEKCGKMYQENDSYEEHIKNFSCFEFDSYTNSIQEKTDPGEIPVKKLSRNNKKSLLQENKTRRRSAGPIRGRGRPPIGSSTSSFPCDFCDKIFGQKGNLVFHIKNIHESPSSFKCGMCPKTFNFKSNLDMHIIGVHTKLRPFKCDSCQFQYLRKFDLDKHLRKCGGANAKSNPNDVIPQENLVCPLCQTVFENSFSMMQHIKYHTKVNGFENDNQETTNSAEFGFGPHKSKQLGIHKHVNSNKRRQRRTFPERQRNSNGNLKMKSGKDNNIVNSAASTVDMPPGAQESSNAQKCDNLESNEGISESQISEAESHSVSKDDKPLTENLLDIRSSLAMALEVFYQKTKLEDNLEKYRCHLCSITCLSDVAFASHMKRH